MSRQIEQTVLRLKDIDTEITSLKGERDEKIAQLGTLMGEEVGLKVGQQGSLKSAYSWVTSRRHVQLARWWADRTMGGWKLKVQGFQINADGKAGKREVYGFADDFVLDEEKAQ